MTTRGQRKTDERNGGVLTVVLTGFDDEETVRDFSKISFLFLSFSSSCASSSSSSSSNGG
jgi:hypothetical protein